MNQTNLQQFIKTVNNALELYHNEDRRICMHLHSNDKTIRNTIYIDEFEVDCNELYLVSGNYILDIESELTEATHIGEDSLCVKFSNGDELYFEAM